MLNFLKSHLVSVVIALFFFCAFFVFAGQVKTFANTYGSGNYGAGNYSERETGTMSFYIPQPTVAVNATTSAYLTIQAGENFKAAAANISVGSHVSIQSVDPAPVAYGPCNFSNYPTSPTTSNPSFSANYNSGLASSSCTVYTLVLKGVSAGTAALTFSSESMTAYSDGAEIFLSATNGSLTVN